MRKLLFLPLIAAALCLAGSSNPAVPKTEKGYVMGTNGVLYLTYPSSWSHSVKRVVNRGRTVDAPFFAPANSNDFNLMIELPKVGEDHTPNLLMLKSTLATAGRAELTNAVEKEIKVIEMESVTGCYFRLTDKRWVDKTPPAGEFKYLVRGYSAVGPFVLSFGLVSNDCERDEPPALEVIKSARFSKQLPTGTNAATAVSTNR
jgi:hypothetical protein